MKDVRMFVFDPNVEPNFVDQKNPNSFINFFKADLINEIKKQTPVKHVTFDKPKFFTRYNNVKKITKKFKSLPWSRTELEFSVPDSGTFFRFPENKSEFILILDNLDFKSEVQFAANGTERYLKCETNYCLWDNKNCEEISFGQSISKNSLYKFKKENLTLVIEGIVKSIF